MFFVINSFWHNENHPQCDKLYNSNIYPLFQYLKKGKKNPTVGSRTKHLLIYQNKRGDSFTIL